MRYVLGYVLRYVLRYVLLQRRLYVEPDLTMEMENMTWFDNVGQTSSDKTIFMNLTNYITSMYTDEQLMGRLCLLSARRISIQYSLSSLVYGL